MLLIWPPKTKGLTVPLNIEGELIQDDEIIDILKMIDHDCKEFAGAFFEEDRSKKFRRTWNEVGKLSGRSAQDCFVDHSWKHFVMHVRAWYANRLTNPVIPEKEAIRLHRALIIEYMRGKGKTAQDVLQLSPGTQQFVGDREENRHISEEFGDGETVH